MVNIAVMGYGTVGSGVVEVINTNGKRINQRIGEELNIKYVLDLRDFPGDPYEDKVIHDFNTILYDDSVTIVCETMGGVGAAYQFTKQALERGKSVCTSNKELVAKHGPELLQIAREHNCNYLFEASVGGGIPIIRPLNYSLTAEKIEAINGILNGTTNYILSKMEKEGADFAAVLKEAQDKGYAERNPEADVEGYDACRKIAILTSLAYGMQVDYEDIHTEGITHITETDFKYAKAMNMGIKLLGTSRREEGGLFALVAPMMIAHDHPLYSVNDVFNAILVKGAGKLPTASAVVSDVVDEVKHMGTHIMTIWQPQKLHLVEYTLYKSRFFVRAKNGTEDKARALFGDIAICHAEGVDGEYGFVTEPMTVGDFEEKKSQLDGFIARIFMN